jgi:signal transduction histidine kinase
VLFNLISNAIKFVPQSNGVIKIESEIFEKNLNTYLKITVHDNGPGIAVEDQRKLFKPFSKIDAHKKLNPNGNGLGLSICKLICNGLGGDITVDCQFDTAFSFWVLVKPAEREFDIEPESVRVPDGIGIQI